MANDDRYRGRERDEWRGQGREEYGRRPANRAWVRDEEPEEMRGEARGYGGEGRETRWRGDPDAFGGGFGNQRPRVRRVESRDERGERDYERREEGEDRYRGGVQEGYGHYTDEYSEGFATSGSRGYAGPGYDAEFGGPRFDRADAGSTGTHGVHPVGSATGAAYGGGFGAGTGSYRSSARQYRMAHRDEERGGRGEHDPHYSEWRRRQIEQLDRDYDEYRREHQSRFHQEFGAWRERRGLQRRELDKVREHMEVIGSGGDHVGTVDCVQGDRIVLTKSDPEAGGRHHSIPCGWIEAVDDKVRLNKSADEAQQEWRDEERSRALFESEDSGSSGPRTLNRSFSGTYR